MYMYFTASCGALACYDCHGSLQPDCKDPFNGNSQSIETCSSAAYQKCFVRPLSLSINVKCFE